MTSEIRTNTITSRAGLSTVTFTDSGPMFSGITTFVDNSTFSVGTGGTIHAPSTNTLNIGVNNTESLRIDSNSNLKVAGIVTATHFHGDGSNLTGITGTTINSNADNRVITGSGTANTLNGEQYFTWNGNNLALRGGQNQNCTIELASDEGDSAADFWRVMAQNSDNALAIDHYATGSWVEHLRITSTGVVLVKGTSIIGSGTGLEVTYDGSSVHGRVLAQGFTARDNYGAATNAGNSMYSPSANTLAFSTNSTERLSISSTGRLAILNNNEDINMDSSSNGQLQIDGNGYTGAITLNATGMFLYHNSNSRIIGIGVNETEVGRFTTGGYEQRFSNTSTYSTTTGSRKGIYVFNNGGTTNCYASLELGATNSSGHFGSTILNSIATADSSYSNHFGIQLRYGGNYYERLRIKSEGDVSIPDGNLVVASGHGINFSATGNAGGGATTQSELFNDYERGTWTPSMNKSGATGSADSQVSARYGFYVKCGDLLWISFYWYSGNLSFGTGGNAWYVDNLPYNLLTLANSAYQFVPGGYLYTNGNPSAYSAGYRWQSNSTNGPDTLYMYGTNNTTNATGGAWEFSGCGTLRVSS